MSSTLSTHPTPLPPARIPFTGDFSGAFWNAQALWAANGRKQQGKFDRLQQIMQTRDFAGIAEKHGTEGKIFAGSEEAECIFLWPHLSAQAGGVGLRLKKTWLANFNPINIEEDWQEIEIGQIGKLSLRGAKGAIDIVVMYLHTGRDPAQDRRARIDSMTKLAMQMANKEEVLTVIVGDMNFVVREQDRWSLASKEWSGGRDGPDQQAFIEKQNKIDILIANQAPELVPSRNVTFFQERCQKTSTFQNTFFPLENLWRVPMNRQSCKNEVVSLRILLWCAVLGRLVCLFKGLCSPVELSS